MAVLNRWGVSAVSGAGRVGARQHLGQINYYLVCLGDRQDRNKQSGSEERNKWGAEEHGFLSLLPDHEDRSSRTQQPSKRHL